MAEPRDPLAMMLETALLLHRVANALSRDSTGLLRELFDEIAAEIARVDPTGVQPRYRRDRIDKLIARVAALSGETFDQWAKDLRSSLAVVGRQQGEAAAHLLVATLGDEGRDLVRFAGPSQNLVKSALDVNPFQGELLRDWADNLATDTVRRVRQRVQLGVIREESMADIIRRVRGKSDGKGGFVGGALDISSRDAETIVRTAVQSIAVDAQMQTYAANEDISDSWEWLISFDSSTCELCLPLSGKVFRYDDKAAPRPPRHHRCRCTALPRIRWEDLGIDPPEAGTRAARRPMVKDGKVVDGKTVQIKADTTVQEWFKGLPAGVQDKMLGPTRATMYRDGRLTLAQLVGGDGKVVRLDQLPGSGVRVRGVRDLGAGGAAPAVAEESEAAARRKAILPKVREDEVAIAGKSWEYARAWNPTTGERVLFGGDFKGRGRKPEKTSGSPRGVDFTSREEAAMKDAILTHNHPSGAPFSPADLRLAGRADLAEIRAVGAKVGYSARRPEAGWDADALEQAVQAFEADWKKAWNRGEATGKLAHELWTKYLGGIGVKYAGFSRG